MTAEKIEQVETPAWTVDELAALTGFTVRTIRYYATLGLVPSPERRGRVAFYDGTHRARLELIQTMQEQGLTLSAIEQQLSRIPADAPVGELEMRRALVSSWAPTRHEVVDAEELVRRAGRHLTIREIATLERLGNLRRVDDGFEVGSMFKVGVDLLDLDIPVESMEAAGEAVAQHMNALALELRDIMRTRVLAPMRARNERIDTEEFGRTMSRLRQLSFDAVMARFQEATNGLVDGTLLGRTEGDDA